MKKPSVTSINDVNLIEEEIAEFPSEYSDDFEEYTSRDNSRELIQGSLPIGRGASSVEEKWRGRDKKPKLKSITQLNNNDSLISQEESLVFNSILNQKELMIDQVEKRTLEGIQIDAKSPTKSDSKQRQNEENRKRVVVKAIIPEGFSSPYLESNQKKTRASQITTASSTLSQINEERFETYEKRANTENRRPFYEKSNVKGRQRPMEK